VINYLVKFL